jgi:hypothetical protein
MDKSNVQEYLYHIQNSPFRVYLKQQKDKIKSSEDKTGSRTDKMRRPLPECQVISAY